MVAMPLYSTATRTAPRLGSWPLTSLSHRLAISVSDDELGNALRTALVLRPEFTAANDNSADVVVTDSHDFTNWNGAQVLVVGSSDKPSMPGPSMLPAGWPAASGLGSTMSCQSSSWADCDSM